MDISHYQTLIFDCDGVILDSNRIKSEAFRTAALPYGDAAANALVSWHVANGGISRYQKFAHFLSEIVPAGLPGPDLETLLARYAEAVRDGLARCAVAPGLAALRARTQAARWLIVSGGDQAELRDVFAARGLADLFDGGIFGSPDNKDQILSRELTSGNITGPALFLGDSTYDHRAAHAAGLDFVFVFGWSEVRTWPEYVRSNGLAAIESLNALITPAVQLGKVDQVSEKRPKVSIITVVYNDPNGLEKTMASVASQVYKNYEFIVVDGASGSKTQDVIGKYRSMIDILISEPDAGIYDAMNKGIAVARGQYSIFMNSDDTFASSGTLSDICAHLDGLTAVIYGHRNYVTKGRKRLQEAHSIDYVTRRMPYCHQAAFYRTEILRKFPFNTTYKYAGDYNQVVELYVSGATFRSIDCVVCDYAAGGKSESGLRPYLEVLKIQFDNFGDKDMSKSVYMQGFLDNFPKLVEPYVNSGGKEI
ncbi:glycosyltransferase [Pseudotabrizicola alkalilacus]|uniref:glycosyltransferase n=1 Tax=Pseudotabrizicola alkalilacus TaxID=2305252 RepID=UPI0018F25A46|nr:glycosyltransferase [Pseudotabrizicola alkalilacus]